MTEQECVRLARAGDAEAWARLVRAYEQPIFRLAYLLIGDAADAEDVAQETFGRAYRNLARFDESRPLRPWLLQIARNLARNRLRSLGRYLRMVERLAARRPEVELTAASPTLEERHEELWEAIRRLGKNDQEIIYLRYFLDLSVAECSQALGIAEGTVKSRLARSLARLKTHLTEAQPEAQNEDVGESKV